MSRLEKLLQRIRNNPKTVKFEEMEKLLIKAGFTKRQPRNGSSHSIYKKDGQLITIPYKNPYMKQTYVVEAMELIGEYFEDKGE